MGTNEKAAFAFAALRLFPASIRKSLMSDGSFRNEYEIKTDMQITFGNTGIPFQQSVLFDSIRKIYSSRTGLTLTDARGQNWQLELLSQDGTRYFALSHEMQKMTLPDFSALSPNEADRIAGLEQSATRVNLPGQDMAKWRQILSNGPLDDRELDELRKDILDTPIAVKSVLFSELVKGTSKVTSLVPSSQRYYNRLVGECRQSVNIAEYGRSSGSEHVNQLISWQTYNGLLLALLLSSHSINSALINIDQLAEKEILQAYEWLNIYGDRISQIGAIEIGLSVFDRYPDIEPCIRSMIEKIRDDKYDDEHSRFTLLSSLIMLVDGEFSRTNILADTPPFWRRLAAIAQAALIEQTVIEAKIDTAAFAEWAQSRGWLFYIQTMADLRREPRWLPDYVSSEHLKSEFIGRIVSAAQLNEMKLKNTSLHTMLLGPGDSLQSHTQFPSLSYLPGPLEGSIESQIELPSDIALEIEQRLSEDVLQPKSFTLLVNSAAIFRLGVQQAGVAAKALREVKHQLKKADNKEQLISVLRGLAIVAAATRSSELADEIQILIRRCRFELGHLLSASDALWTSLISAASQSDLTKWCDYVGQSITDIAFQSIQKDEAESLLSYVQHLCHIVPELWCTCGRAEAALRARAGLQ